MVYRSVNDFLNISVVFFKYFVVISRKRGSAQFFILLLSHLNVKKGEHKLLLTGYSRCCDKAAGLCN